VQLVVFLSLHASNDSRNFTAHLNGDMGSPLSQDCVDGSFMLARLRCWARALPLKCWPIEANGVPDIGLGVRFDGVEDFVSDLVW